MNAQGGYTQTELERVLGELSFVALRRVLGSTVPKDFTWVVTAGDGEVWIAYLWKGDAQCRYQPEVRACGFAELLGKWRNVSWTYERWRAQSEMRLAGVAS